MTSDSSDLKSPEAAIGALREALSRVNEARRRRELSGFDRGRYGKAALEEIGRLLDETPARSGERGREWAARFRTVLEGLHSRAVADAGDEDGEGGATVLGAMHVFDAIRERLE